LADSAFPAGGFAHSGGLEAAWQQGEIRSSGDLEGFINVNLVQTGRASLPFLNDAFREPERFSDLDRVCDVFLSNHVANRASRAQGQAWLIAVGRTLALPSLERFRERVLTQKLPGHFAPVFGVVTRELEICHSRAVRLFLFLALRTLVAAAVRLGITGPLESQSLQARLGPEAERVGLRCASLRSDDAAQTAPLLDILHGAHDRLYSRLFQS
jgi:urease accessory protein